MTFIHVPDSAAETLVLLGVIVLQSDLKFDRLEELPLLVRSGMLKDSIGALHKIFLRNLTTARDTTKQPEK
jgi:hypothetical protein